ncbi:Uncharacterised protein [Schaalia odontolytica]|uniref:Uncharacterized protein n=1 Tax=Schaalia odontolytica TaxID=1660 RepID=A0A2X0U4C4_9ACTO|nr:Uncharacterised protein [Schaalia odontolytica]
MVPAVSERTQPAPTEAHPVSERAKPTTPPPAPTDPHTKPTAPLPAPPNPHMKPAAPLPAKSAPETAVSHRRWCQRFQNEHNPHQQRRIRFHNEQNPHQQRRIRFQNEHNPHQQRRIRFHNEQNPHQQRRIRFQTARAGAWNVGPGRASRRRSERSSQGGRPRRACRRPGAHQAATLRGDTSLRPQTWRCSKRRRNTGRKNPYSPRNALIAGISRTACTRPARYVASRRSRRDSVLLIHRLSGANT